MFLMYLIKTHAPKTIITNFPINMKVICEVTASSMWLLRVCYYSIKLSQSWKSWQLCTMQRVEKWWKETNHKIFVTVSTFFAQVWVLTKAKFKISVNYAYYVKLLLKEEKLKCWFLMGHKQQIQFYEFIFKIYETYIIAKPQCSSSKKT